IFLRHCIGAADRTGDDDPRHREQRRPISRSTAAHGLGPPPAVGAVLSMIKGTDTARSQGMKLADTGTSVGVGCEGYVAVFTSTGFSEVILLPRTSTTASLRNA